MTVAGGSEVVAGGGGVGFGSSTMADAAIDGEFENLEEREFEDPLG